MALRMALKANADLHIAQAQVAAAAAAVHSAREFPNPTLGVSVAHISTDGRGNATPAGNGFFNRSYDSIVALSQLLELGGKRGLRQASARAGERALEAQREDVQRLLMVAVGQAYVGVLGAREQARVLAASAASLLREAGVADVRYAAGDIPASDKAQIEIAAARLGLDAAAAQQSVTAATIALESLLGVPEPHGETILSDRLDQLLPQLEAVDGDAPIRSVRPDVAAAEAALAKAEADFTTQKRAPIPDLTVSLQFEHNPPDAPNTVGVGVSLPLPLWNTNTGSIRTSRALRDQAAAQLDKVRIAAMADVATARAAFGEARARAAVLAGELAGKSSAVLETVAYAYDHGGAALVDLLTAQRNDNELQQAVVRAQADAAGAALALAAALNRLDTILRDFPPR